MPKPLPTPAFFGAYFQVPDLERSLAFYRDVLGLEVVWNDGVLAMLHASGGSDTLVLRLIEDAQHHVGDSGVTRLFWRVDHSADLDVAEEVLSGQGVAHTRHKDEGTDGLSFHDPNGLGVVLIWAETVKKDKTPPSWLYWTH